MIELDRDPRLVAQPLDRASTPEQGVLGQHDLAHAAAAEVRDDAEPAVREPALHLDRPRADGERWIRDDGGHALEAMRRREIARPGGQTTGAGHGCVTSGAERREHAPMPRWATPRWPHDKKTARRVFELDGSASGSGHSAATGYGRGTVMWLKR